MRWLAAVSVLLAFASAAYAGDPTAALAALERSEPALAEVCAAALRHAGLHTDGERAWSRRARLSALLPTVTIRADQSQAQDEERSRSSAGTERLDRGADAELSMEVRASWRLDQAVFHDAEIRAVQAARRLHQERALLVAHVTSLYFQRRKLQIAAILQPTTDPGKRILADLAIEELTAQIDGITGGYLTASLAASLARRRPGKRFPPAGKLQNPP